MLVSLDWLKDYVDIDCSPEELADKLVSAGFEVEEIIKAGDNCKRVVVGKIVGLDKHPDADKLQICQIDIGSEVVQIVTGANNIKVGDLVPAALDNSDLPCGMHIKKGKLRGVPSNGMLCSGEELKLTEQDYPGAGVYGIMILNEDYPLGTDINKVIGNDDVVFDIAVTANRPDCNSIIGIAREVAAVLNKPVKPIKLDYSAVKKDKEYLNVSVSEPGICPRYMAAVVKDIVIKESPRYIQKRLKAVGLRPINNIVDITNYVLTEIGQPMHAFNYDCLSGGKINVRLAGDGEKAVALDGKEYTLNQSMLVIADDEKPSAIAGIMGGLGSGITEDTSTVVFESAKFARDSVRRTSRKLNLKSGSSSRFERGIDLASQELGLKRALALITETDSGVIVDDIIDVTRESLENRRINVPADKINKILGITVPSEDMVRILNCLEIKTELKEGNLECEVPLYREDIINANDLSEEIIRFYGYDHINCTLMGTSKQAGGNNDEIKHSNAVKEILIGEGMNETLTYSFTTPKSFDMLRLNKDNVKRNAIKLLNPLGEDFSVMRTTLAYSMLEVIAKNINRSNKELRFFEFANVYIPDELPLKDLPCEYNHLMLGVSGKEEDFYSLKGIVENVLDYYSAEYDISRSGVEYLHPGVSADIACGKDYIGYFGEVHPNVIADMGIKEAVYIAELNLDALAKHYDDSYEFRPIPKFPIVERDIAILVKESVTAKEILDVIKQAGGKMLVDAEIFDIYRGKGIEKGYKSVAVNVKFGLLDRTLVDEEINGKMAKIIKRLEDALSASLR